jgi:hypothetical protein
MSHHAVLDLAAMGAYGSRFSESGGKHETTADWRAAALDPDGGRVCRCGGAGGGVRLARRRLRRGAHDTWHASISHNCNNPSFCGDEGLGGGWGSVEFDCFATGTITGSGQFTGCGHFQAGGGGGAFHATIVVTAARIVPAGPDDPNPGGRVFFVEHNVVNGVPDDPDFLGDTGIPVEPGHYSDHPAPGVANMVQVTFTPET